MPSKIFVKMVSLIKQLNIRKLFDFPSVVHIFSFNVAYIFIYLEFLLCYCYTLNAINYFVFVLFIFINEPLGLHIEYIGKYGFIFDIILFIFGFNFFIVLGKNENFKLNKIFVFISLYVDLIV